MHTTLLMMAAGMAVILLAGAVGPLGAQDERLPPAAELPASESMPDPLVMRDGRRVANRGEWERRRRPELKRLFQHYMYGELPPPPGNLRADVVREDRAFFEGKATKRELLLRFGPEGAPPIHLMLLIPNRRSGPAPAFLGIAFCPNFSIVDDPAMPVPDGWMYPHQPGVVNNRMTEAGRGKAADVWNPRMVIDRGYALATFYNGDVDPDFPDFTNGVHPHFPIAGRAARGPHDWGTIAAWAWGMHRAMDYLVRAPGIDRHRIAVVGHSRNGKASLLAAAFDERIALAIPHQAGCGGTAPSRGTVGESVRQINTSFPHWFCDEFKQFNDAPEKLPFDQNALVALCAPRPVLFSNAEEDEWANPAGQFEVLRAADSVYRFLGAEGLGADSMPPSGRLLSSRLGYFIRPGKHSMTGEDWAAFLDFADTHLRRR